jgi:hypothetical protein
MPMNLCPYECIAPLRILMTTSGTVVVDGLPSGIYRIGVAFVLRQHALTIIGLVQPTSKPSLMRLTVVDR